ncbi:MAG: glycosyltransferase family 2 protein [Dehalococcoidia bacterium]|nr:glycosyltransferase family 2 protein [Dehalococcoidia bacterium]
MWNGKTVSVALPTYNEKESIRACIDGFFATGVVDEVVVCNNNATPGTSEEVAKTAAREIFETRQGYGWSCRKALAETTSELIILSEPDASFEPSDVFKLLAYSQNFSVVFGSRTNSHLIWTGANMGWFMKWGNWAVAKYMELLLNVTSLTDVGCTMRLLTRDLLDRIQPFFTVGGSHFGPEMMLLCICSGSRVIEIPLNYKQRVGKSMATGSRWQAFLIGLKMIELITRFCLKWWLGLGPRLKQSGYGNTN